MTNKETSQEVTSEAASEPVRKGPRTDIHRVGAIIPAHYQHVLSYSLATTLGGFPVPSIGITCVLDRRVTDATGKIVKEGQHDADGRCCVIGLIMVAKVSFASHGNTGKCTICGAHYIYGDVWVHKPTGEHIHVGHDCVAKYEWVANRTDWESKDAVIRSGIAKLILKKEKEEECERYLAKHPGLKEALAVDHPTIKDIGNKLVQYGSLTVKQIAFVIRLAAEKQGRVTREVNVNAPTGRQTFRGTVVSQKVQDSSFGQQTKITVKVPAEGGVWMAFGTAPKALLDEKADLRGVEVEITATLTNGRDPYFAFMGRPNGTIVPKAEPATA